MYDIARYLDLAGRLRVAQDTYTRTDNPDGVRTNDQGYDPLGSYLGPNPSMDPIAGEIGFANAILIQLGYDPYEEEIGALAERLWDAVYDAARTFIHDWDAGTLTNVAEALGVDNLISEC